MKSRGGLAALLFAVLGGLSACRPVAPRAFLVTPLPGGGYLVAVSKPGAGPGQTLYDCQTKPDGSKWEPTCVEVDFKKRAPSP